jgi:hypothetical protein
MDGWMDGWREGERERKDREKERGRRVRYNGEESDGGWMIDEYQESACISRVRVRMRGRDSTQKNLIGILIMSNIILPQVITCDITCNHACHANSK